MKGQLEYMIFLVKAEKAKKKKIIETLSGCDLWL